ncbi:Uncharacterized conserved protein, DUF1800 family [Granulicella pectinivorans]|uniref:Uncharacterized conserved protein, DUF1800 family n=1 Tax=Granulicella pectinivorans TaxID=474950 RepID=A0A1I6MY96_9BACT|nr:DUF1800 domain-containing protein [Granulicella pectinivorans]SFS20680.1 Uncharacterized conserved protein, DUF1800 family [Granulicella pectinivorans]
MSLRVFGITALAVVLASPLFGQQKPAVSTKKKAAPPSAKTKPAALVALNERERAQQMLNRFTFGPRPGEVDRVQAEGTDKWFEEQMQPASIPDKVLDRKLQDFPTLFMTPDRALLQFPDRGEIERVAKGQVPYPTDPALASMYEVLVFKQEDDKAKNKVDASGKKAYDPTPDEVAAEKKAQQADAARVAGVLFALPKNQRMAALIKMPVADRIAFTGNLAGDQRNLLLNDFTPREREIFQGMAAGPGGAAYQIGQELSQAKMVRAVLSERQLQEVMADFWFNHFNVFVGKDADQWYTTSYDRDAIRAHALGKFRDLLMATAKSPAMSIYLDNWLSIGPDSIANGGSAPGAKKGNKGLNENYGREVMELHTVGVNGGYTQADVTALAAILTGWSVDRPYGGAGGFLFDPKKHEPGVKQWFGHEIGSATVASDGGLQEGVQALTILAASPKTAHFISWKLAQRFVADDPPAALVDRMAATYMASDGDIKAILRTLAQSPEFNSTKYFRNKVKTPVEYLASAFRTTATDPTNPGALVQAAKTMGMPVFYALPPTGYYITAEQWMNSSALVDRLNFAYKLTNNQFGGQKFDSPHVLALGLMEQPAAAAKVQPAVFAPGDATPDGVDTVLKVLETTMIGGGVSAQTNQLIHKQVESQAALGTGDRLNLLTALVMGAPEFQLR